MPAALDQPEFTRAPRANTLISAMALVGDTGWPVRIRNLSACGAMVESDVKVDVNSSILLTRGQLRVPGKVAWHREGVFGVRFFEPLEFQEWTGTPTKEGIATAPAPRDSQTVSDKSDEVLTGRLCEEINYVARAVRAVAECLSEDPILRVRHASSLQELCLGEQMLTEIAAILPDKQKLTAIEEKATGPMRNRLCR